MSRWTEYLLDITFGVEPPAFVPYERETGNIITGLTCLGYCPGKLVGVFHDGDEGQTKVEAWIEANPDWHSTYAKAPK